MNIARAIKKDIIEYLNFFPVILISGARQVGKSTLALELNIPTYITLDDINIYEMAKNNPKDFIESLEKPVVIDEIQRVPQLLISIKEYIDKDRKNGMFILTGSANLKGFKDISDSLAGRVGIVELYPFSLKEKNRKDENIIDIFENDLDSFILKEYPKCNILESIIDGGYPEILKINSLKAKYLWFSSYIRTYIEFDAKELANIRNKDKFIKIYRLCMLRSSKLLNKNELQKETRVDNKTFDSYFNVLKHIYQISTLQPYFNNRLTRLIKTPKIFAIDSGILSYLLQISTKDDLETSLFKGAIFETFIYTELLKASTYSKLNIDMYYYGTIDKKEIDFILEFKNKVIAIEVKDSSKVTKDDFKHIYSLRDELKTEFSKGIVIYTGESLLKIDDKMYAVPIGFFN